jgi:hypothetical protein
MVNEIHFQLVSKVNIFEMLSVMHFILLFRNPQMLTIKCLNVVLCWCVCRN